MPDKFTPTTEDKLEDALALLAAGVPIIEILAEAGDDAGWLRPLLETAGEVGVLRSAIHVPSPEASLQRMLAYGQELTSVSPPTAPAPSHWSGLLAGLFGGGWLPRLATGLVSALFLLVLLGGTLTALAQRSLPGQPLYSLKRAQETLRLSLTGDPDQRAQLRENYNQQRQREAQLLLEQNQAATVDFYGRLETVTGTSIRLNGLTLQLTPQTKITGNLATSAQVEVQVLTQPPDRLLALTISVVEPASPTPTPLLMPTATFTPVPSPTATNTRSLSSATDTLILPTATPLPPTATPTLPTLTATPLLPPAPPTGNDNNNPSGEQDGDNTGNNNDNAGQPNDDNGGDNSGPGSSGNDNSDGGGEHSGGDDNSGSGGGGGDNSGSGGGGGDDNSGSGGGGGHSGGSG